LIKEPATFGFFSHALRNVTMHWRVGDWY